MPTNNIALPNSKNTAIATITDITKEASESVYVMNNSGDKTLTNAAAGVVQITVSQGNDSPVSVIVPKTWVPVDLSLQVSKEYLLKSSNFRRAVQTKLISIIKTEHAEHLLETDLDAAQESAKASQSLYNLQNSMNLLESSAKEVNQPEWMKGTDKEQEVELIDPNAPDAKVDIRLQELMTRDDITEPELYSLVRNIDNESKLNRDNIEYIINNTKFDKVLGYVTNKR